MPDSKISNLWVRPCVGKDLDAITEIYRIEVLEYVATFETEPPGSSEMISRWKSLIEGGFPWIVCDIGGKIAGYAYAAPFRSRPAFRYTVENSIYVAQDFQGQGIGRRLLAALIGECEKRNFRQMIAVISDQNNVVSIRLHERADFAHVGVWKSVGWKFGRWLDCVVMQRPLGAGANDPAMAVS